METDQLYRKLIAAAKSKPEDDRVPYAFEKRIMANLPSRANSIDWVRGMWRAAISCSVFASLLFVFVTIYPPLTSSDETLSSSQLEEALQVDVAPSSDSDDVDLSQDNF